MADLMIKAKFIIPVRPPKRIIRDGAIVVEDGRIVFVGKRHVAEEKYSAEEVIEANHHVAIPGLVNAHNHLFQSIIKNIAIDMVLIDWLRKAIHPILASFRDSDFYYSTKWGVIENIKSGVTTLIENHYGPKGYDYVAQGLMESGIRTVLARGIYELNVLLDEFREEPKAAISHTEYLIQKYHGKNDGKMMVAVAPMHPYNSSKELLLMAKELSDKYGVPYHTHTAESVKDQELVKELHGKTDVALLYDLGILGPRYHAVHSVQVTEEEVLMLAKTGAHVIHNPESNLIIGSGIAPIPNFLKAGVNVALGTDGAGSNNNQDMIEAMRFAVLIHRGARKHPNIITAWDALEMATINGAKALGLENEIGSLEPGKKADITIIDLESPSIALAHDPLGSIVYCANAADVDTVIVDGKVVMRNRKVLTIDEEKAKEEAWKVALDLLDRARQKFDMKFPYEEFIE